MSAPTRLEGEAFISDQPELPPFTETLSWSQRHPRVLVAAGIALTVASGVAGLAAGLGGGL